MYLPIDNRINEIVYTLKYTADKLRRRLSDLTSSNYVIIGSSVL